MALGVWRGGGYSAARIPPARNGYVWCVTVMAVSMWRLA